MTPAPGLPLDELTTRVLAPNPSPMTLEGTNTYLIGKPGSGEVVVVDPGPDVAEHRRALEAAAAARDAAIVAVVLTHHHVDHAEAAGWAGAWGADLHAFSPALVPGDARPLADGARIERAGVAIAALHTPGHASDHLCLRVEQSGAVLTGDHVLGRGSTVVAWPDGDMRAYLASLRRLAAAGAHALHPGHGPSIDDPAAAIDAYLEHRLERERQVIAALRAGDRDAAAIVARVYADVPVGLHPAARRSVRAHLDKLVADGAVRREDGGGGSAPGPDPSLGRGLDPDGARFALVDRH